MRSICLTSLACSLAIFAIGVAAGISEPRYLNPWPWPGGYFDLLPLMVGGTVILSFIIAIASVVGLLRPKNLASGFPVLPRPAAGA
jgi:hypothetical protein